MFALSTDPREARSRSGRVLVVEDDPDFAEGLDILLTPEGYEVHVVHSAAVARNALKDFAADVALIDIRLAGSSGINLIAEVRRAQPKTLCVMMTAFASTESAVEALQEGAYDYLRKPIHSRDLLATLDRCFEHLHLEEEKRLAEHTLRESEARFRSLVDNSPTAFNLKGMDGRYRVVNRQFEEWFGISGSEAVGKTSYDLFSNDFADLYTAQDREVMESGTVSEHERDVHFADGSLHRIIITKYPVFGADGQIIGVGGINTDVTERAQAEERFRQYFDLPLVGSAIYGPDKQWIRVNDKLCDLLGYSREELMNLTWADVTHPDDLAENLRFFDEAVAETRDTYAMEKRFIRKNGDVLHSSISVQCVRHPNGDPDYFMLLVQDLTERKRAEEALRENEERLRQAVQLSGLGYWIWDAVKERCIYCSEEYAGIHGITPDEYIARAAPLDGEFSLTHPEDHEEVRATLQALRAGREIEMEYRVVTPGGEVRHVREIAKPIFDEMGTVIQEHGTAQDITERKKAEEQLRQAQKMEAIGQLTGGVAHDFNNLLAVIMGNAELVAGQLEDGAELTRHAKAVIRAAHRGAELTQRLLAFSRRQPLRPQAVDLSTMVTDMTDMLSRTLGATIELETRPAANLPPVLADSAQVESALLNLAINARDAMPDGGRLTIKITGPVTNIDLPRTNLPLDGREYLVLAVSDTGTGMSPEVLEHVFEPFFTTKRVGEGSGLGLSMVYGFAKQSEGHVTIESEVGQGTTVKLCLPRAETAAMKTGPEATADDPRAHGETVLVVEDDPDVRSFTVSLLESLGYDVVTAEDGKAAFTRLANTPRIDLLISDVILRGGISGPDVAGEARRRDPGAKILFMSGYAEVIEANRDLLDNGSDLLNKPFRKRDLARKVRALLDETGLHSNEEITQAWR